MFDNAIKFNGPQSVIGVGAKHLRDMFDGIFAACVNDVDSRFLLTGEMRMGLHENLYSLSNANRLVVMQKMRDDKCLSIRDCAGETTLSIDMMCMKEFFRIDMFVRHLLVNQSDSERSDAGSDVESEGEEADVRIDPVTGRISSRKYWHWRDVEHSNSFELYTLKWETKLQLELGSSIRQMINDLKSTLAQKAVATAFFSAIASAVMLPALLLNLTNVIDSLWTIATERADAAGIELAEALLRRPLGSKPVTLVGFSMGARLIFSCLRELSRRASGNSGDANDMKDVPVESTATSSVGARESGTGAAELEVAVKVPVPNAGLTTSTAAAAATVESKPKSKSFFASMFSSTAKDKGKEPHRDELNAGTESKRRGSGKSQDDAAEQQCDDRTKVRALIQDVALLGIPASGESRNWAAAREIVCGRLVNGYSSEDLVLGVIYRFMKFNLELNNNRALFISALLDLGIVFV